MIQNPAIAGKSLPDIANPGTAADLLTGKQLIGPDGEVISGSMPSVAQATPSITVSSGGLITAKADQSGGKVDAGSRSATKQLTTQGGKTVTPGTSQQTAVYSGRYTTGNIYVAGDSDLKPENIKSGVNIFGVAGTLKGASEDVGSRALTENSRGNNYLEFVLPTTIKDHIPSYGPLAAVLSFDDAYAVDNLSTDDILFCAFFADVSPGTTPSYITRSLTYVNRASSASLKYQNIANGVGLKYWPNLSTGPVLEVTINSGYGFASSANGSYTLTILI